MIARHRGLWNPRHRRPPRSIGVAAALFLVVAAVAGCTTDGGGDTSSGNLVSDRFNLSGPQGTAQFAVGSEAFTDQELLGNIAVELLRAAGADVIDQTGSGNNQAVRQALEAGEIDLYWEYTGTGWVVFLSEAEPISDPEELFRSVAETDLSRNGIKWLDPAPGNNTYAIAQNEETHQRFGIETISDLARLVNENPGETTLCYSDENAFSTRPDGLPGLQRAYDVEFPQEGLNQVLLPSVYDLVARDDGRCDFGVVFSTSGLLQKYDELRLLEDDQRFFPPYNPAPTMRTETFEEYPELEELFAPVAERLTTETLQELNAAVRVDGRSPRSVAREWLRENGFIK